MYVGDFADGLPKGFGVHTLVSGRCALMHADCFRAPCFFFSFVGLLFWFLVLLAILVGLDTVSVLALVGRFGLCLLWVQRQLLCGAV